MGKLDNLKPERVFYYFEQICGIPHGSYNVKGISDYLASVAQEMGLEWRQDEEYNIVIKKPASPGYENAPALIIQGHMDMVCVKEDSCDIDMEKEAIKLMVDDTYVFAQGTSLGGDDGVAVAMALAILEDDSIEHPPLEVVITVQEEVGMEGATALDVSDLKGKYMLNIDSEEEGHFLAGCAGGASMDACFSDAKESITGEALEIVIEGLKGGHSGIEIDKGRANASVLMGRVLYEIKKDVVFSIISIEGGEKDNAIADLCRVELVSDNNKEIVSKLDGLEKIFRAEYRVSDPDIEIKSEVKGKAQYDVMSQALSDKLIYMLMVAPDSVQTMSMDIPGLVESSLNLGILHGDAEGFKQTWAIRSSVRSLKNLIVERLKYMIKMQGGEVVVRGDYPEWEYDPNSKLCALSAELYEKLFGKKAVIETVHAGLECGIFGDKIPGLDMVSMGPDILEIHTPRERLDIASTQRCYELVLAILREFKNLG